MTGTNKENQPRELKFGYILPLDVNKISFKVCFVTELNSSLQLMITDNYPN